MQQLVSFCDAINQDSTKKDQKVEKGPAVVCNRRPEHQA